MVCRIEEGLPACCISNRVRHNDRVFIEILISLKKKKLLNTRFGQQKTKNSYLSLSEYLFSIQQ